MRARGVGLRGVFDYTLTRTSEHERSGLSRWEAEGGVVEGDVRPRVESAKPPRGRRPPPRK